jgi:hypothetical protein
MPWREDASESCRVRQPGPFILLKTAEWTPEMGELDPNPRRNDEIHFADAVSLCYFQQSPCFGTACTDT